MPKSEMQVAQLGSATPRLEAEAYEIIHVAAVELRAQEGIKLEVIYQVEPMAQEHAIPSKGEGYLTQEGKRHLEAGNEELLRVSGSGRGCTARYW